MHLFDDAKHLHYICFTILISMKKTIAFRTTDEQRTQLEKKACEMGLNLTDYILHCISRSEEMEEEKRNYEGAFLFTLRTFQAYRLVELNIEDAAGVDPAKIKKLKDIIYATMLDGLNMVVKEGKLPKKLKKEINADLTVKE